MGKKILIIEDDEAAAKLATMILEREGYDIAVAEDGNQGIKRAAEFKPDLALVDLMLPSIHGFAVIEKLRENKELAGLRIMVCSSKTFTQDIDGAMDAGADDYITKPYKMEALSAKVKKLLETGEADLPIGRPNAPTDSG
ncbi:MAG: response regulator transcription factor [Elusimicrobiota bacterium]